MTSLQSFIVLAALMIGIFWGLSNQLSRIAGLLLVEKQRQLPPKDGYKFQLPDGYLTVKIQSFWEDDFEVQFVDGWELGRSLGIFGAVSPHDDENPWESEEFNERFSIRVTGFSGSFTSTVIGWIDARHKGEARLYLPQSTVDRLIDEVRRNKEQLIVMGFKRTAYKSGRPSFPIYSFSMSAQNQ